MQHQIHKFDVALLRKGGEKVMWAAQEAYNLTRERNA